MVNLRFNFKMDLVDISTIDFSFAESYSALETDPFLEKSYPEEGTYSQRAIILELTAEEAELLPEQFYALATVNFKNGETIKAHAFKNTAKEEALSAALALEDTEFNINFFIDEVAGGGSGVDAYINGVKLEGNKTAAQLDLVKASEDIKIWEPVWDDNDNISKDPADYPGIKSEDIAIYMLGDNQLRMFNQPMEPTENFVYWTEASIKGVNYHTGNDAPPTTLPSGDSSYRIGDFYIQGDGENIYVLANKKGTQPTTPVWRKIDNGIYPAIFNEDGSLNLLPSNYPNIQINDFIVNNNRIWRVTSFSPNYTRFYVAYLGNSSKAWAMDTLPTTYTVGLEVQDFDEGEVWQTTDGKYYKCIDKVGDGGQPVTYTLTWQEVIMIPKPAAADAGKTLTVNANGEPEWV